jgi:membrane-associated phospholipid phosphatase
LSPATRRNTLKENRPTSHTNYKAAGRRAYAFDWIIIAYCALMLLLILSFGRPVGAYVGSLGFYAFAAALAFGIMRFVDPDRHRLLAFVRFLYPAILFTWFYRETGDLMFLFFDSFYDWQLVAFEKSIFGVRPTIYIDRNLLNVWLNEIFSFGYFMYYPMIPAFLLPVFLRNDRKVLIQFNAAACITFFMSYLLFSLYPVEGPRWHFAAQYLHTVDGPVFRQMVNFMIDEGAVRGGAMPSSHTGIALVITLFCYRYYKPVTWVLTPILVLLSIGTFWGRFHYVSDVVVGAAIAILAVRLVWSRYARLEPDTLTDTDIPVREEQRVT